MRGGGDRHSGRVVRGTNIHKRGVGADIHKGGGDRNPY